MNRRTVYYTSKIRNGTYIWHQLSQEQRNSYQHLSLLYVLYILYIIYYMPKQPQFIFIYYMYLVNFLFLQIHWQIIIWINCISLLILCWHYNSCFICFKLTGLPLCYLFLYHCFYLCYRKIRINGCLLYSFVRAALTKDCKLNGLNNTNVLPHKSEG